jgi:hypothetical protein
MPKYYIKSGDIRFIIDSSDHISAILSCLKRYKRSKKQTSNKICISETGFENFKNWDCFDTNKFIQGP